MKIFIAAAIVLVTCVFIVSVKSLCRFYLKKSHKSNS